jgi:thymidylate kinase
MAWIVLEGVDRCGKSSIAEFYKKKGFEVIHLSAPDKKYLQPGYAGPSYLDDLMERLMEKTGQNVVWDRSWYGELIWPLVYNRESQLTEEDIDAIREIETHNDTTRLFLMDPDVQAHWQRCVDNKEPLNLQQFNLARRLFSQIAHKYNFAVTSLPKFREANGEPAETKVAPSNTSPATTTVATVPSVSSLEKAEVMKSGGPTKEQTRLEQANAINAILKSKKIFKQNGTEFETIEGQVRTFLNAKLGELLGTESPTDNLSKEDIQIVREFVKRLKDKQTR